MTLYRSTQLLFKSLFNTFFPRYCCVCGHRLLINEETMCISCLSTLPLTHIKAKKGNIVERLLWNDKICTERADSLLYYIPKSKFCKLFFQFKYYNNPDVAVHLGKIMAHRLLQTDFFNGVDCIIPIPLSKQRFHQRGYNQSERLAHGISLETGIAVNTTAVQRVVDNPSQTHLNQNERIQNVKNIFCLSDAAFIHGKHILLVDDMITTGSTTRACARVLVGAGNVKISVISLGLSSHNKSKQFPHWIRP